MPEIRSICGSRPRDPIWPSLTIRKRLPERLETVMEEAEKEGKKVNVIGIGGDENGTWCALYTLDKK